MSDTTLNSFGQNILPATDYGIWSLSTSFSCQASTILDAGNTFPFNTVVAGELADYNPSTHLLTVSKTGLYAISWFGQLSVADPGTGTIRHAIISYQKVLSGIINNPSVLSPIISGYQNAAFGVSLTLVLQATTELKVGLVHNASTDLTFGQEDSILRITRLATVK